MEMWWWWWRKDIGNVVVSIAGLSGILDVLGDYLTAMTGVFSYGGRRPSQNVYLV